MRRKYSIINRHHSPLPLLPSKTWHTYFVADPSPAYSSATFSIAHCCESCLDSEAALIDLFCSCRAELERIHEHLSEFVDSPESTPVWNVTVTVTRAFFNYGESNSCLRRQSIDSLQLLSHGMQKTSRLHLLDIMSLLMRLSPQHL